MRLGWALSAGRTEGEGMVGAVAGAGAGDDVGPVGADGYEHDHVGDAPLL